MPRPTTTIRDWCDACADQTQHRPHDGWRGDCLRCEAENDVYETDGADCPFRDDGRTLAPDRNAGDLAAWRRTVELRYKELVEIVAAKVNSKESD